MGGVTGIKIIKTTDLGDGRVGVLFGFPAVWDRREGQGWRRKISRHAVLVRPGAASSAWDAVREFLSDKEPVNG